MTKRCAALAKKLKEKIIMKTYKYKIYSNERTLKKAMLKNKFKIDMETIYEGSAYDSNKIQKENIWFGSDGYASINRAKKDRTFNQMRRDVTFLRLDYGDCCLRLGYDDWCGNDSDEKACIKSYTNMIYDMKEKNRLLRQDIRDGLIKNNRRLLIDLVKKNATYVRWNSFPKSIQNESVVDGRFLTCNSNDQYILLESDDYFYIIRVSIS
jgi:hypothetical protein